jgi:hypothetical protein
VAVQFVLRDEVTGSGSDRVIVMAISDVAWVATRSLPLPILTSSPFYSPAVDILGAGS